jgi:hypothetical protein
VREVSEERQVRVVECRERIELLVVLAKALKVRAGVRACMHFACARPCLGKLFEEQWWSFDTLLLPLCASRRWPQCPSCGAPCVRVCNLRVRRRRARTANWRSWRNPFTSALSK